jgi:hypothetical protein
MDSFFTDLGDLEDPVDERFERLVSLIRQIPKIPNRNSPSIHVHGGVGPANPARQSSAHQLSTILYAEFEGGEDT